MSHPTPKRISGRDNPEFKRFLSAKARKDRRLILVEGPKLVEEAVRSGFRIVQIAVDPQTAFTPPGGKGLPQVHFAPSLLKALSEVETHQGVIALVERPPQPRDWLENREAFVLLLDRVQDPGNVGALFRIAEASGVTGVLLTRGCADPLSAKALRASAGSAFRVPHLHDLSVAEALALLAPRIPIAAALPGPDSVSIFESRLSLPLALALGSEGQGLDPAVEAAALSRVRVPTRRVESLNVAVAGGIALYEIARRAGILRP